MSITTYRSMPVVFAAFMLALTSLSAAAHDARPASATGTTTVITASGTVTALTVDNKVTGVTLRYLGLRMDDGHSVAISGTGVDSLANGERVAATGMLNGEVLKVSSVARYGAADSGKAAAQGSGSIQIQGTLRIFHMDFFDNGRGEYGLAVASADGQVTKLNVAVMPDTVRS